MSELVLECKNLNKNFGGVTAVANFSMELSRSQIFGIIGPNGAGKTTIFNLISGVTSMDSGTILLDGELISGLSQESIALKGIGRTFQNTRLFSGLTVLDNVKAAIDSTANYTILEAILGLPRKRREERRISAEANDCLNVLELDQYAAELPGNLPYGIQRRVEIARALALKPKVLLLDEPCAGLNPEEENGLAGFIRLIREKYDPAILVIEHSMDFVMNICEKIYVQNFGNTIAVGKPEEIQNDPEVKRAYLG